MHCWEKANNNKNVFFQLLETTDKTVKNPHLMNKKPGKLRNEYIAHESCRNYKGFVKDKSEF